jgi:hypothetical protein
MPRRIMREATGWHRDWGFLAGPPGGVVGNSKTQ